MSALSPGLAAALDQQLSAINERLTLAASSLRRGRTDDFLLATAQQISAFSEVVVPALSSVPDGRVLAREFLSASRRLERAMVIAKAKQYGQAQNVSRPWTYVWDSVRESLTEVIAAERHATERLTTSLPTNELDILRGRFGLAVRRSPTRPHPRLPHRGVAGRASRAVTRRADRVWDEFEGRVYRPLPDVS